MFSPFNPGGADYRASFRAPRTQRFDEYYRCYPLIMAPGAERPELNYGSKIFLPPSALDKVSKLHVQWPIMLELINGATGKHTHAGVLEFVAEEGRAYIPQWMMQTLQLDVGDMIQIKTTSLELAKLVKLQPQSVNFLDITDPRAVLEKAFRNFAALTKGDVFNFEYNDEIYDVAVLDVKPESEKMGVSMIETDVSVEFAPPVGYVEPEKPSRGSGTSTPRGARGGVPAGGLLYNQGTMAQAINYDAIAPGSAAASSGNFRGEGQKLSSKKSAKGPTSKPAAAAPATPATGSESAAAGRVTRSSATLLRTSSANENPASPQPQVPDSPARSHKRPPKSSVGNASPRAKRTRLTPHKPGFYGEPSSDSGGDSDSVDETPGPDVEQKARSHQRRKARENTTPKKSSKPARATVIRSPRKVAPEKSPTSRGSESATGDNGIIPDWSSLPYHILVQIFRYAAAPLNQVQQAKWLTAASGVCRAFAEPALTALYRTPPLLTRPMAHGLVSLLCRDPATTLFNYRQKVEELWIDVEHIASKTFKGQPLDLPALVGNLPRLKSIQFFHQKDDPPYRSLDGSLRWHYPPALFEALSGTGRSTEAGGAVNHAKLLGWQWNRRLMGPDLDLAAIKALHETPPFSSLEKVSFVNYQVPSLHAGANVDDEELAARDDAFIRGMADAIAALPALRHLAIESSTVANSQLLLQLPDRLETLELVNCWESLSLSFVTVLGAACPNLEVLSVDFKTFKHHEFYHDSDPSYDDLLTADQVPDWPQSLETLQLLNMKKWTAEAAETLFQSLVDSAPRLLRLRRLELKAMLSIPIQERSRLRNKWGCKLKQVFLREREEPKPLFSLRQKPRPPDAERAAKRTPKRSRRLGGALAAESPSRRSSRIAGQSSNSSSRAGSIGRELRHGLHRPSYAEPDTDEDEEEEEEEDNENGAEPVRARTADGSGTRGRPEAAASPADAEALFRHGMCEKVEIQLDNQKSAETTLTMDDFLDSGHDDLSDDDWVGQDDESDNGYAW
ncbi:hypothetical protein VTH06DRAFT_1502 [Thermothelomyces fergusii]